MSQNVKGMIVENIRNEFKEIETDKAKRIAEFISEQGHSQKIGDYFVFRLFNPVCERKEVFLGNILFNDYISKLVVRAYESFDKYQGEIELIYNDLESFYYLISAKEFGSETLKKFENDLYNYFESDLKKLFFSNSNPDQGIYGSLDKKVLNFYASNRSVFPFYSIPNDFASDLVKQINQYIKEKLNQPDVYPTELTANVVTFYSKDGREKQSTAKFLIRRCKEGIISESELESALYIKIEDIEESKDDIKEAIKDLRDYSYSEQELYRNLLQKIMMHYSENNEELYIEGLMTKLNPKYYIKEITEELLITEVESKLNARQTCSLCGKLISKNKYNKNDKVNKEVQFGESSSKFINRLNKITPKPDARNKGKIICMNCLLYSFLRCKFLGTTSEVADNQIPEKRNLVFFYGQIPEDKLNKISGILNSLYYATGQPSVYTYETIENSLTEIEGTKDKGETTAEELIADLQRSDEENQKQRPKKVPPTIWNWYQDARQYNKVKTNVFSLGQGKNKLYTFVLPYALNRSDDLQRRFSQNKVAVYSMLSFLAKLTGEKGNFYYLSVPQLTDKIKEENVYYYKDQKEEDSLEIYELLTEVAWELINENCDRLRGDQEKTFTMKLKLAKDLSEMPLIKLSEIYRKFLGDSNNHIYRNLSNIYDDKLKVTNLFPLLNVSAKIRNNRKEVKFMGQEVKTKEIEEFTKELFSELVLISGLFPKRFSESPTKFEKYPRFLIKNILKYDKGERKDVLAGYKEWASKILHATKNDFYVSKEEASERLNRIRQIIEDYEVVLSKKTNLLYLKRSLLGWITEFLYPVYSLVNTIDDLIEDYSSEAIDAIKDKEEIKKMKGKINFSTEFDDVFELAKEILIQNSNYYAKSKEE